VTTIVIIFLRINLPNIVQFKQKWQMGPKWLLNELVSAIWPLTDANISDQLSK